MKSLRIRGWAWALLAASAATLPGADGAWLRKVPAAERQRLNPYAGQAQAIAAGKIEFEDHCAKCHGADALGRHERPSLRGPVVEHATDGELAWLLRNGVLWKGMPSWSSLPTQERWQIIAYLRSLPPEPAHTKHP